MLTHYFFVFPYIFIICKLIIIISFLTALLRKVHGEKSGHQATKSINKTIIICYYKNIIIKDGGSRLWQEHQKNRWITWVD